MNLFKWHLKSDFPVFGSHSGSTLKAASLVEPGSKASLYCQASVQRFCANKRQLGFASIRLF
jgi:hypothetical protein